MSHTLSLIHIWELLLHYDKSDVIETDRTRYLLGAAVVSYTHLDVYKRQLQKSPCHNPELGKERKAEV